MRLNHILAATILVSGSVSAGCSGSAPQHSTILCGSTDYTCLTNAEFQYRQEAERYGALADRYRAEADMKAVELGQNSEEVKKQQALAQHYSSESEKADALARQFRSELPHNMMH